MTRLTRESQRAACKNPLTSECGKDHHMDDGHGHGHTLDDGHPHPQLSNTRRASQAAQAAVDPAAAVDPDEVSDHLLEP